MGGAYKQSCPCPSVLWLLVLQGDSAVHTGMAGGDGHRETALSPIGATAPRVLWALVDVKIGRAHV